MREVEVPQDCGDRAAVIAVVIDALVAPYFWPAGKPRTASEPTSEPTANMGRVSALDLMFAASEPTAPIAAPEPTSQPMSLPASTFVATPPATSPVAMESTPKARVIPMALYLTGAPDFALNERTRGRFSVGFSFGLPSFVRWFVELSFLTLRSAEYQSGRIDYGEGHLLLGADLALLSGWFVGLGAGLQVIHAVATGFDTNRKATLLGASAELRTGYRHTFAHRLELGAQLALRADLFRQRLLIDDVAVAELLPIHVGVALTAGLLF